MLENHVVAKKGPHWKGIMRWLEKIGGFTTIDFGEEYIHSIATIIEDHKGYYSKIYVP